MHQTMNARYVLREHPAIAQSWHLPVMRVLALAQDERVLEARAGMCAFATKTAGVQGEVCAAKEPSKF